jgi:hypothetical protein
MRIGRTVIIPVILALGVAGSALADAEMSAADTLIGIGVVAAALLILGLVALIRCDRAAIPDVLRALSRFVGHPDHQPPRSPVRQARGRRQLGAGTGPPPRRDSRRPASGRAAVRRRQGRRPKRKPAC